MLKYGRYILGVCRQCREKHCSHLKQFLSTDSHTMESNIIPPRNRFSIPSVIHGSPVFEDSLISNEDYIHPVTPASAKGAYNNYVCKLHRAYAINQPFRHLDSVLAKDCKELHPRTKHHYASFAKQGIRPVLESIAPGQAGQLKDHVLKTVQLTIITAVITFVTVKGAKMTKLNLAPYLIAPYKILSIVITMHSLQNLGKRFYRYSPEISREVG